MSRPRVTPDAAKSRPGVVAPAGAMARELKASEERGDRWEKTAWCLYLRMQRLEAMLQEHGISYPPVPPLPCTPDLRRITPCKKT